jgi:GAF domain-containing protein
MRLKHNAALYYAACGAAFGFLFPLFSTFGDLLLQQLPLSLESLVQVQTNNPLHWVIDTAPIFLALFAALAGQRQNRLIQLNQELAQQTREREEALQRVQALQANLEQQVMARTAALRTAIEVGQAAASTLEMDPLTHRMVHLIQDKFELAYVGLYLVDSSGRYAILKAGASTKGHRIREGSDRFEIGGRSLVGSACALLQPRMSWPAKDESETSDSFSCPDNCSVMALPLTVGKHLVGALDLHSARSEAFADEELSVLKLIADQLALAVDNARKFSTEAALLEATSPLYRANRALASATTVDEVVRAIIGVVACTEADGCAVAAFDSPPSPGLTAGTGSSPQRGESNDQREMVTFLRSWDRRGASRFPTGVPMKTEATHLPLSAISTFWVVDDITRETHIPEQTRQSLARLGNRALVNVPLRTGDRIIGFVLVYRTEAGPFSSAAIRLYETLVDQAAVALERAHLLVETRRRADHDRLLREIASRMRQTLDMETMLQTSADEIYQALDLDEVVIRLVIREENDAKLAEKGNGDGYMG